MISRWRDLPAFERLVQTWDTAFKGEDPTLRREKQVRSMTAGQLWGVTGGRIYLLDAMAEYADPSRQLEMIREMHQRWPLTAYSLIEDEANGSAVMSLLRHEIRAVPIVPDKSKYLRLIAVRKFIAAGIALFAPEGASDALDLVVEQLLRFPSAPNDHVDALSQVLRFELLPDPTSLPQGPGQMDLESRLRAMVG
jgi:predicted phage terminase large subunit-like protein